MDSSDCVFSAIVARSVKGLRCLLNARISILDVESLAVYRTGTEIQLFSCLIGDSGVNM
jgi:hypothetical protein